MQPCLFFRFFSPHVLLCMCVYVVDVSLFLVVMAIDDVKRYITFSVFSFPVLR